jgi:hypothetical protein
MPVTVYEYPFKKHVDDPPLLYVLIGEFQHLNAPTRYYLICTLTYRNEGLFKRIGLHRVLVHYDNAATTSVTAPLPIKDAIDVVRDAIEDFEFYKRHNAWTYLDDHMLEMARAFVPVLETRRLSEIRSSCAQRAISRAWRKCISNPEYRVCIERLKREFEML